MDNDMATAHTMGAVYPLPELVFDVTYTDSPWTCYYVGVTGAEAAKLRVRHPDATITPRKLCRAPSVVTHARIATPSPAGTIPGDGRGGDL